MRNLNSEIQLIKGQNNGIDWAKKKGLAEKSKTVSGPLWSPIQFSGPLRSPMDSVLTQISHLKSPVSYPESIKTRLGTHAPTWQTHLLLFISLIKYFRYLLLRFKAIKM